MIRLKCLTKIINYCSDRKPLKKQWIAVFVRCVDAIGTLRKLFCDVFFFLSFAELKSRQFCLHFRFFFLDGGDCLALAQLLQTLFLARGKVLIGLPRADFFGHSRVCSCELHDGCFDPAV